MNYINEFDPHAAAWTRELIAMKLIPPAEVDERSICDVCPSDLSGFTQCHFFGGISGWPLALMRAGVPDSLRLATCSCPCQPFSAAGAGGGTSDERHLWPVFHKLVEAMRWPLIFGEQVSSAAVVGRSNKSPRGKVQGEEPLCWYAGIHADLERAHYFTAALDIPAAGFGTDCEIGVLRGDSFSVERGTLGPPHIRQRLYWFAVRTDRLAESEGEQPHRGGPARGGRGEPSDGGGNSGLAHAVREGREGQPLGLLGASGEGDRPGCGLADPDGRDTGTQREQRSREHGCLAQDGGTGERVADTQSRGLGIDGSPSRGAGHADECCPAVGLANTDRLDGYGAGPRASDDGGQRDGEERLRSQPVDWTDFHLIPCLDGKSRRAQPGIFPLAPGVPRGVVPSGDPCLPGYAEATGEARTMRLRGYGNALAIPCAVEFIKTCMEVIDG